MQPLLPQSGLTFDTPPSASTQGEVDMTSCKMRVRSDGRGVVEKVLVSRPGVYYLPRREKDYSPLEGESKS